MAYTVTRTRVVFGNKRGVLLKCVADAATEAVATGLKVIDHVTFGFGSCTTTAINVKVNANASNVAANGTLGISGATSGDELYFTVYGAG